MKCSVWLAHKLVRQGEKEIASNASISLHEFCRDRQEQSVINKVTAHCGR
jgi:hypothetical protein